MSREYPAGNGEQGSYRQRLIDATTLLNSLFVDIDKTLATRGRSPDDRKRHADACQRFHESYSEYPWPVTVDERIQFLETDPMFFRSGYYKEGLWKNLRHEALDAEQRARVGSAALGYLSRRMSREFWYMCRTMAMIADEAFWRRVEEFTEGEDSDSATRAAYLLVYRDGLAEGEKKRVRLKRRLDRR